ncbi:MAG: BMP family ABC transporter substrate-binding protein [Treponema sp.]|nr:BMP family ABC transporter substrate-binding protein [Treponema sp.]
MKKVLAVSMCLLVAGFAFAAGGRDGGASGGVRSILLTDATGIDDASFNAAAWRGMLQFYGDTWANPAGRGRLYEAMTAATMAMYDPNLALAVDEGFDLIITTGFTWADATARSAAANPRQNYLIVDVVLDNPNIMSATFAEHEGSFLVGAAAALQAIESGVTNPRFGFIGGIAGAVITRFHVGFVQGVRSVLPNADVLEFYVNDWGNPAAALLQARNWYNDGVFAIFSAAGGSGNGTIQAAIEMRQAGRNVWAIGVDSDQFESGIYDGRNSAVLTSMLKQVEAPVVYALNAVRDGTFSGRNLTFGLADNGVGFSDVNPALSRGVVNQVNQIRQRVISGEIPVADTLARARMLPNFPNLVFAIDG